MKTMLMVLCVASLGLLASCTKESGSGDGSSTPLIIGKWKCTYNHWTQTVWVNGEQYSFYEQDNETGFITEFHLDGTTNQCVYSVQGSNLTMCNQDYHIDKLTATELKLTRVEEGGGGGGGDGSYRYKNVYTFKYTKL